MIPYDILQKMTKPMCSTIFLFILLCNLDAADFNIFFSINSSKYSLTQSQKGMKFSSNFGYVLGTEITVQANRQIGITTGLHFSSVNTSVKIDYTTNNQITGKYSLNFLSMPFLMKLSMGNTHSPYLIGGAELFIILSHELALDQQLAIDIKEKTNSFGINAEIGVGVPFALMKEKFFTEFYYSYGLTNLLNELNITKIRLTSIKLVLGFIF